MKADLTGDGETSRGVPQFRTEKVKIFFGWRKGEDWVNEKRARILKIHLYKAEKNLVLF